jgi:hypothetical protein
MDPSESEPGLYAKPLREPVKFFVWTGSVVDPHHFDADPDADPLFYLMRIRIPIFHPEADPYRDPSFQIKAQTLDKVLKQAHIQYILACHLQIDADPDPDPDFYLMRIFI